MEYCENSTCAGQVFTNGKPPYLCASCVLGKLNVVLDLDQTLITAEHKLFTQNACKPAMTFENWNIYKRPYLDLFLEVVFKRYNVYIYTAAQKDYATFVLKNLLKPHQIPLKVLTSRDVLRFKRQKRLMPSYGDGRIKVKPLTKLHIDLRRSIMIDDTQSCFSHNIRNGILIQAFDSPLEQLDDEELLKLLPILDTLSDCFDVRENTYDICL